MSEYGVIKARVCFADINIERVIIKTYVSADMIIINSRSSGDEVSIIRNSKMNKILFTFKRFFPGFIANSGTGKRDNSNEVIKFKR